jgi:adenosylhomocysteine nucleosidase
LTVAGVVAALAAEARALRPAAKTRESHAVLHDGTLVAVSGIGCSAADAAARRLIHAGATALVSWGMAGGLDPALSAGAVCLPREVIGADGSRYATASHWRDTLRPLIAAQRTVTQGSLLTSIRPIDSIAAKGKAYRETGASAVDMESAAVAAIAQSHGIPFIALRIVVDTANDVVPTSVAEASASGRIRMHRLLYGFIKSPGEIAALVRLARRYRAAVHSLEAVARVAPLAPPGNTAAVLSGTS